MEEKTYKNQVLVGVEGILAGAGLGARLAVSPSGQLKYYLWATQPAHFPPSTSTQNNSIDTSK